MSLVVDVVITLNCEGCLWSYYAAVIPETYCISGEPVHWSERGLLPPTLVIVSIAPPSLLIVVRSLVNFTFAMAVILCFCMESEARTFS